MMKNLATDKSRSALLRDCRDRLMAFMKRQNDTFEKSTWYRQHWTDGCRNILRGAKGGTHELDRLRTMLGQTFGPSVAAANFQPRDVAP